MTTCAFFLLKHAAKNREEWLKRFYAIGKDAVRSRKQGELFGFLIEPSSNAESLRNKLRRGGVELTQSISNRPYLRGHSGAFLVRMDQPYSGFAKALLERQHYPDLRDNSGHPIQPYDVTAHTLSLLMGVTIEPLMSSIKAPSVSETPQLQERSLSPN
jgi:hypothetical protein